MMLVCRVHQIPDVHEARLGSFEKSSILRQIALEMPGRSKRVRWFSGCTEIDQSVSDAHVRGTIELAAGCNEKVTY
jgi:hypothetical protein